MSVEDTIIELNDFHARLASTIKCVRHNTYKPCEHTLLVGVTSGDVEISVEYKDKAEAMDNYHRIVNEWHTVRAGKGEGVMLGPHSDIDSGTSATYKLERVRLRLASLHSRIEGCEPDSWGDLLTWLEDQCERAERADGVARDT